MRDIAAILEAVHGPAPGDPYFAPPPLRPYTEEVGADPGKLRIGLAVDRFGGDVPIDPVVVEGARAAAEMLEGLGHEVDTDVPVAPEGEPGGPMDVVEMFMTRWRAGQDASLRQFSLILGRQLGPGRRRAAHLGARRGGSRQSGGEYLNAVALHQSLTRMFAMWFEAGHDLLLTPTMGEPPPPLGTFDDSGPDPLEAFRRAERSGIFTAVFNFSGHPAISLPLHETADGPPRGRAAGRARGPRGHPAARRRPARRGPSLGRSPPARVGGRRPRRELSRGVH